MKTKVLIITAAIFLFAMTCSMAWAHCQIPCGIYDDSARFSDMWEDVETIEKSMNQIILISKDKTPDWNQLVRWVNNKEEHANKLTETVTYYFMTQRIKPAPADDKAARDKYVKEITLLHEIIVTAMKTKQTTDVKLCDKLKELIFQFEESYMGKEAGKTQKN